MSRGQLAFLKSRFTIHSCSYTDIRMYFKAISTEKLKKKNVESDIY